MISLSRPLSPEGFTLIEVLIYVALMGMAVSSFVYLSVTVSASRSKTTVTQEVQANTRVALDLISQQIRAATGINSGASVFDADPGVLSLAMADSGSNPTVIDLSADDGVLQITRGAGPSLAVTSDEVRVTNLVFTNLTDGERENVRVEITVAYANDSGDVLFTSSQSLQTSVSVRQ